MQRNGLGTLPMHSLKLTLLLVLEGVTKKGVASKLFSCTTAYAVQLVSGSREAYSQNISIGISLLFTSSNLTNSFIT
jgi:hypothetical protein